MTSVKHGSICKNDKKNEGNSMLQLLYPMRDQKHTRNDITVTPLPDNPNLVTSPYKPFNKFSGDHTHQTDMTGDPLIAESPTDKQQTSLCKVVSYIKRCRGNKSDKPSWRVPYIERKNTRGSGFVIFPPSHKKQGREKSIIHFQAPILGWSLKSPPLKTNIPGKSRVFCIKSLWNTTVAV